jgi:hypothetical protein
MASFSSFSSLAHRHWQQSAFHENSPLEMVITQMKTNNTNSIDFSNSLRLKLVAHNAVKEERLKKVAICRRSHPSVHDSLQTRKGVNVGAHASATRELCWKNPVAWSGVVDEKGPVDTHACIERGSESPKRRYGRLTKLASNGQC